MAVYQSIRDLIVARHYIMESSRSSPRLARYSPLLLGSVKNTVRTTENAYWRATSRVTVNVGTLPLFLRVRVGRVRTEGMQKLFEEPFNESLGEVSNYEIASLKAKCMLSSQVVDGFLAVLGQQTQKILIGKTMLGTSLFLHKQGVPHSARNPMNYE